MGRLLLMLFLCCSQVAPSVNDRGRLAKEIKDAPLIVRATVVVEDVEPPQSPRPWSGFVSVYQRVRYEVKEVLKGEVMEYEIEVRHPLVQNSLTANENAPRLSYEIFRKGNEVILLLEMGDKLPCQERSGQPLCIRPFHATSADFGGIPATGKNLGLVKEVLAARGA